MSAPPKLARRSLRWVVPQTLDEARARLDVLDREAGRIARNLADPIYLERLGRGYEPWAMAAAARHDHNRNEADYLSLWIAYMELKATR